MWACRLQAARSCFGVSAPRLSGSPAPSCLEPDDQGCKTPNHVIRLGDRIRDGSRPTGSCALDASCRRLRHTLISSRFHEVTMPLTVNLVSADEAAARAPEGEVVEEVVILKAARAQEQAREHADRVEFEQAQKILARPRPSSAGSRLTPPRRRSCSSRPRCSRATGSRCRRRCTAWPRGRG